MKLRLLVAAAIAVPLVFPARRASAGSCVRPNDPGGIDDYDFGSATVKSFGNDEVLVWYVTDGADAVNTKSSRSDLVPDDVAEVAQVTSDALASYATMGFRPPVSDADAACGSNGGDGRLDVYLVKMVGGDGMTVAEPGRCTTAGKAQRCASFIFAQANYATLYPSASIGIHTVLPHETFHTVQNAYDANIDRFWAEGTAQWAAKTLDPSLTDLERFLPDFFAQTSHALDAPSNGVTSAFLYGAAVWPVYLTAQHGDDVVKQVLEQEGIAGDAALTATDAVLQANDASSMAKDYPLFSAWNAATGKRAGSGGYAEAASYPEVTVAELADGASGITSGYASFYFHAQTDSAQTVSLDTDATRNAGLLVPLVNGAADVANAKALPADLDGEGVVVVSGITDSKKDAPFSIALAPSTGGSDAGTSSTSSDDSGGCAITNARENGGSERVGRGIVGVALAFFAARRARRSGRRRDLRS